MYVNRRLWMTRNNVRLRDAIPGCSTILSQSLYSTPKILLVNVLLPQLTFSIGGGLVLDRSPILVIVPYCSSYAKVVESAL